VLGGSFCPTDGFVDPNDAMTGFTQGALQHGACIWKSAQVTGFKSDRRGICSVETTRGEIATRRVVNAAGAWASQVAGLLGIDLPVKPLRRMLIPTEPFDGVPHSVPMVIDMSNGFHFRPEGRGFLLAWNDPDETYSFRTDFDPDFVEKVLVRAADRVPCFENLAVNPKRAWAGLYEMSPDHHGIIGEFDEMRGFYAANGFSGHGVMHAPATGKIVADLITRSSTDIVSDVTVLHPRRFRSGNLLHETALL
jgi:sarcosine oxidase subunit beta